MTNTDQGREGVKNPENLADVICAWPLNEVFTLFFSLGAISYSEWSFSAITRVHPQSVRRRLSLLVLFSLQMLPEPKMATTQTRFPA